MPKTAAERQQAYQQRLKGKGRMQFRVTLSEEASAMFQEFLDAEPGVSKSRVLETLIEIALEAVRGAGDSAKGNPPAEVQKKASEGLMQALARGVLNFPSVPGKRP